MPRKYKRTTDRQNWSMDAMIKALDAVKDGMPYKTASRQFSVPVMSLKRRAKCKNKVAVGAVKMLGSKKTVFTPDQERELVGHIKDMESRMYGLTKQDIVSLAYQLAVKNNIPHPFSADKEKAGMEWLKGFRKRHPDITLRTPESTSAARARAFNKPVVSKFFSILKETQENQPVPAHRIFNVDETSLCTVPTKNTKVFAQTGRKQVSRVTSAERGETTTAVICCSAAGNFIPPMFIFRRMRMKIELMDGAPPGSVYACNSSGWMKVSVFDKWFDHFIAHVKPSADDPVILLLDGHLSHTKNLNVILKARENHVTIICLPPHCTHKLQPLDVGVMYPLSIYHNQELEKWMNNHPGRVVSAFQIAKIFGAAYLRAAVPLNAISGFAKCGIYPLNQDVFTEVDYVAAEPTEMEVDTEAENSSDSLSVLASAPSLPIQTSAVSTVQVSSNPEPSLIQVNTKETVSHNDRDRDIPTPDMIDLLDAMIPAPSLKKSIHSQNDECQAPAIQSSEQVNTPIKSSQTRPCESLQSLAFKSVSTMVVPKINKSVNDTCSVTTPAAAAVMMLKDLPSTSFGVFAPQDLVPLPKIQGKRVQNIRKRRTHTTILTSSPYKDYLEDEMKKKKEKEEKQKSCKDKTAEKKTKGKGVGKGQKPKQGKRVTIKEENKKMITVKQRQRKGKKSARKTYESKSSSDEDDAECMFCTERYSRDAMGEGWICCVKCLKWGHEACAGLDSDDEDDFICDFCVEEFRYPKKQLDF